MGLQTLTAHDREELERLCEILLVASSNLFEFVKTHGVQQEIDAIVDLDTDVDRVTTYLLGD